MNKKEYTIGLDIGTNSVGWSVINNNLKLISKKMIIRGNTDKKSIKKNLWGVSLFSEGKTAEETRLKRNTKRTLSRKKNRIISLQKIFEPEMDLIDNTFFERINESNLIPEHKCHHKNMIFGNKEEEIEYRNSYPTIYHLREDIINSPNKKFDIRLIYLSLAHILKNRGHFNIETDLDLTQTNVKESFVNFIDLYNDTFLLEQPLNLNSDVDFLVGNNYSKKQKIAQLKELFKDNEESLTKRFDNFSKLIIGNLVNFKKEFESDEDLKIQLSKDTFEEDLNFILSITNDDYLGVFMGVKQLYDSIKLTSILKVSKDTQSKFSTSKVESYDNHFNDLILLKELIRKNLANEYNKIFNDPYTNGYCGYISNNTSKEDFYSFVKNLLEKISDPLSNQLIKKIENDDFLNKQRSIDNCTIPNQIHLDELIKIIQNQSGYYPFLKENYDQIVQSCQFKIPYYVGPLGNSNSRFSWVTRYNGDKITPMNFEQTVNLNQSAKDFIERMTNVDAYLPNEKVLPSKSFTYELFTVLNELTKVKYCDESNKEHYLSSDQKLFIIDNLFRKNKNVTSKSFLKVLNNELGIHTDKITGVKDKFNSSLTSYHDFLNIGLNADFLGNLDNFEILDDMVKIVTIFNDRKMVRSELSKYSTILNDETMNKMEKIHYSGWGRLSNKLLNELKDEKTGKTIIEFLINDDGINRNFMQLINDDNLSFKYLIETLQPININLTDNEKVQQLSGSPSIKKGILMSLKLVDEIVEIMGYQPKNIVIEMARENLTTQQGLKESFTRKKKIEKCLSNFKDNVLKSYPIKDKNSLKNDKVFLFYMQNGIDLYTGKEIDFNDLLNYEIDHIIPQSFIKDDSMDNKVLTHSTMNLKKDNNVPSMSIIDKMDKLWNAYLVNNLISESKYFKLTLQKKGGLTDDVKSGFIKRQLVETRQITKHVARLLDEKFDDSTQVLTIKSNMVNQLRTKLNIPKLRNMNDSHHAHDSYLVGVMGLLLLSIFPNLIPEFVYGRHLRFNSYSENKATAKKIFYTNIMNFLNKDSIIDEQTGEIVWDSTKLETMYKTLMIKQVNVTKKVEIQKGKLYNDSIYSGDKSDKLLPIKKDKDPKIYGGFMNPVKAYSILIKHMKKSKETLSIVGILILEQKEYEKNPIEFLNKKGFKDSVILMKLPKYSLFETENGSRYRLVGDKEMHNANQFIPSTQLNDFIQKLKKRDEYLNDYLFNNLSVVKNYLNEISIFLEKNKLTSESNKKFINSFIENADNMKFNEMDELSHSLLNLFNLVKTGTCSECIFMNEKLNKKRLNITSKDILNATFINQSITGLYETRIDVKNM